MAGDSCGRMRPNAARASAARMKWGLAFPPAPTVPRRGSPGLGGEAFRLGLFRSRLRAGGSCRLAGVLRKLALPQVSPSAPRPGRSPGGSPSAEPEPGFRSLPSRALAGAWAVAGRFPGRSRGSASTSHGLASWTCRFAVPGRSPVPPGDRRAEAPLSPMAARRLASRFCRTGSDRGPEPAFGTGSEGSRTWALDDACHLSIR